MPQRTPLYDEHRRLGARMVDFAGWEMPVSYRGALEEHGAVRRRCGLFDVSHMGEVEVRGPGALDWCDRLTVNAVRRLRDGDAQYSLLCEESGGVIDDLIVYRLGADAFLLVVNAASVAPDLAWMRAHLGNDVELIDRSAATALLAVQGPRAEAALAPLATGDLSRLRPFTFWRGEVAGQDVLVSRTGYTGEDGFELAVDVAGAVALWRRLLSRVEDEGGLACGLAARDTLRLEAALPLCGTDMDRTTSPLEAGLGWVVKLDKPAFIGKAALLAQREAGLRRRLVGIELGEPGVPRHGQPVWAGERTIGQVTSGTKSPTLGSFIGLAYVECAHAAIGSPIAVEIRGRRVPARVVQKPFYRRPR